MDFVEPGCSFIFVRKLTMEVIEKAIHPYTEDNFYWLKLHHFSTSIESDMFDKLQEDQNKLYDSLDLDKSL